MELEKFKCLRKISNTDGRPCCGLTNEKWQEEFALRKKFVTICPEIEKKKRRKYSIEGRYNSESYDGPTNYQRYNTFISDVARNIKAKKHIDYCFFIYQIMDLYKIYADKLKTKFIEDGQYWEVWTE